MSFIGSMIGTALLETTLGAALAGGIGTAGATALTGAIGQGIAGAGIGALGSAVTGGDPGQGALMGGVTGGVLGGLGGLGEGLNAAESAASNVANAADAAPKISPTVTSAPQGLQQFAPSAPEAYLNSVNVAPQSSPLVTAPPVSGVNQAFNTATNAGQFSNQYGALGDVAQKYAGLGTLPKAGIAGALGLATNAMTTPDVAPPTMPTQKSQFQFKGPNYNYSPSTYIPYDAAQDRNRFPIYPPTYMAAGGITDLDGYASNAQNVGIQQNGGGITNIPSPNEVADPEGYAHNSMQLMAQGGIADLGGYAAGGRSPNLLDGPGTGVSDDIPASIAGKQPARLAGGEYVIPSRIVSELGQGSTDAGAKMLDGMVQKIQAGRKKTLGNKKEFAKDTHAYKHLPV